MKRLIMMIMMMMAMATSCYAASWEWIGANANYGIFFDKDSIVFDMDKKTQIVNRDKIIVWEKLIYDDAYVQRKSNNKNIKYSIHKIMFDLANNRLYEEEVYIYDKNSDLIAREQGERKWESIVPSSIGENVKTHAEKYARAHTEEIEQRTRGN